MENQDSLAAPAATPQAVPRNEWPLPPFPQEAQEEAPRATPDDAALYQRSDVESPEVRGDAAHRYEAWGDASLDIHQITHAMNQSESNNTPNIPTRAREFEPHGWNGLGFQHEAARGEIEHQAVTPSGSDPFRTNHFVPRGESYASIPRSRQHNLYDESGSPSPSGNAFPFRSTSLSQNRRWDVGGIERESVAPRWQLDAEVTLCPICGTQFSFFVRKHHCRKCGRVVCNACSPHRITIPYQYIVRPPAESGPLLPASVETRLNRSSTRPVSFSSADFASLGGGERVRLCNPCVPDPNVAPPHAGFNNSSSSTNLNSPPPYSFSQSIGHSRSSSTVTSPYGHYQRPQPSADRQSTPISVRGFRNATRRPRDPSILGSNQHSRSQNLSSRGASYSNTEDSSSSAGVVESRSRSNTTGADSRDIHDMGNHSSRPSGSGAQGRSSILGRNRSRPTQPQQPPRQISEDDECWVCHHELPSRLLPNFETLRSQHVEACIASVTHTTSPPAAAIHANPSSSSVNTISTSSAQPSSPETLTTVQTRRTGVFPYIATEKDCVDDAECTICLEEFEVGVEMGRLECFCRFHLKCIREWFTSRPGKCPVHQHGGGY